MLILLGTGVSSSQVTYIQSYVLVVDYALTFQLGVVWVPNSYFHVDLASGFYQGVMKFNRFDKLSNLSF